MLRKYCDIQGITIRKVIFEDHSAKSFKRPEWEDYMRDLKRNRGNANLLLFTKWDRFFRNAGDAFYIISSLHKFGIEPQDIEQPLDMSIPESKFMMAFYLTELEVENDRRALNIFFGMRKARKEGRHMSPASFCL